MPVQQGSTLSSPPQKEPTAGHSSVPNANEAEGEGVEGPQPRKTLANETQQAPCSPRSSPAGDVCIAG